MKPERHFRETKCLFCDEQKGYKQKVFGKRFCTCIDNLHKQACIFYRMQSSNPCLVVCCCNNMAVSFQERDLLKLKISTRVSRGVLDTLTDKLC